MYLIVLWVSLFPSCVHSVRRFSTREIAAQGNETRAKVPKCEIADLKNRPNEIGEESGTTGTCTVISLCHGLQILDETASYSGGDAIFNSDFKCKDTIVKHWSDPNPCASRLMNIFNPRVDVKKVWCNRVWNEQVFDMQQRAELYKWALEQVSKIWSMENEAAFCQVQDKKAKGRQGKGRKAIKYALMDCNKLTNAGEEITLSLS